jgi:hypothetical protein
MHFEVDSDLNQKFPQRWKLRKIAQMTFAVCSFNMEKMTAIAIAFCMIMSMLELPKIALKSKLRFH